MIRDTSVLLDYEAKRNPILANFIKNIETVSLDEIKAAQLMPWMRQALLGMKKQASTAIAAEELLSRLKIIDGKMPDPVGEMRRWVADNMYVGLTRGHLEMRCGDLIWLDGKGGAWIDTIHVPVIDPKLMVNSTSCGAVSRLAYMGAVLNKRRQMDGDAFNTQMTMTPGAKMMDGTLQTGFQIYRPG